MGADGHPIIFLHGLLGSSRNWRSVSKELLPDFQTHCIDLRNHGNSFQHNDSSIQAMSKDLENYLAHNQLNKVLLCGHSLGGKVAMRFACDHSSLIHGLVVADIAPRNYPPDHHVPTLESMLGLDLEIINSRKDADEVLSEMIPNWAFRQFLLTNLVEDRGIFSWKPNLDALRDSIQELSSNPLGGGDRYEGKTLFIRGGKSGYLRSEHIPEIMEYFPKAEVKTLMNAGHDVHVEDRKGFVTQLRDFLDHCY